MTAVRDPFIDLWAPVTPVDPDPDFASGLRARLERVLALPKGVIPVTTPTEIQPDAEPATRPETAAAPRSAAIPYLAVADARAALIWYADVFGAQVLGEPIVMPDGRIGHAELSVAGGLIYLADAHPEIGVTAPRPGEAAVSLMLPVDDADAVRTRAIAAGASGDREPYDGYGTRNAWIVDPFGHRWGLSSPLAPVGATYRRGDLGYVSVWAPDEQRAADFYAAVLGWTYAGRQAEGVTPTTSVHSIGAVPALFCGYVVDDVAAAVEAVRAAGGAADEPVQRSYGLMANCIDDQGTRFAVYEQPDDATGVRPPANGARNGDLSYLTLEVVDTARARAFYGAVLGWQATPGRIEDGWQIQDTVPMIGLSGGHEQAAAVPMWRVDDIERAVAAVRRGGGTATDPQRQPYGLTSGCSDDQGLRFYLGQL
jgi:uncharacterized glyoxalase superfamily protein PhnB